jgi:hypothetical protein
MRTIACVVIFLLAVPCVSTADDDTLRDLGPTAAPGEILGRGTSWEGEPPGEPRT